MVEFMATEQIEAIQKEAEAASKGPWYAGDCPSPHIMVYSAPRVPYGPDVDVLYVGKTYASSNGQGRKNLDFIANARTNVPLLCEQLLQYKKMLQDQEYRILVESNGRWTIHDMSQRQKVEDDKTSEIIMKNILLEKEVKELREELARTQPVKDDVWTSVLSPEERERIKNVFSLYVGPNVSGVPLITHGAAHDCTTVSPTPSIPGTSPTADAL